MTFRLKGIVLLLLICLLLFSSTMARTQERPVQLYGIINSSELKGMLDSGKKDLLVIDTRNPEEYRNVHIPVAINIPQKRFDKYKHLLPEERLTKLVFYCNGIK